MRRERYEKNFTHYSSPVVSSAWCNDLHVCKDSKKALITLKTSDSQGHDTLGKLK
jgi:hypothetical protein